MRCFEGTIPFVMAALMLFGCGESTSAGTGTNNQGGTEPVSQGGGGAAGFTGVGATAGAGAGAAGAGGATTGSTPGATETGAFALVSSGNALTSSAFTMIFSLGQSTQNQGHTESSNYNIRGGFIGATGSSK